MADSSGFRHSPPVRFWNGLAGDSPDRDDCPEIIAPKDGATGSSIAL